VTYLERLGYEVQPVAAGREQADRLRPLNIVRRPASPRVVCPEPSPEQMTVLNKERSRYGDGLEHIKGVIYPNGLMVIEFRIYKSSKPYMRRSISRAGKALFTAHNNDSVWSRSWTVTRGAKGRKPVGKRNLPERIAMGVITGRITPAEAAERGWNL
jgi:hypothetical protein